MWLTVQISGGFMLLRVQISKGLMWLRVQISGALVHSLNAVGNVRLL